MLLFPVYIKPEVTEATSKTATPSTLTFASTRSSATVHLDSINAVSGSFATSTQEQTASFSISTNNATGYTLTLKTTGNDTTLTDDTNSNTSTNHLNTISSSATADDFTVNTWGLVPNKYRSNNTTVTNDTSNPTYFPASSTGFTIDETTAANTTANNYTVGIGIKVNYDTRSATYTNDTLIAEYVANPVTYSISYYSNTSDTVDDMPLTNPQTGTISDPTTSTGDIITTLASAPNRANYVFLGWCLGNSAGTADVTNNTSITNITTTNNIDSCSSTTYDAGQSFGIDATGSSPDAYYLYALWQEEVDLPCAAGYICYRGNGATAGTMPDQEATSNTNINLTPSNFSRPGYGFAGWNTSRDGTGTQYGPGERINPGDLSTEGLKLYAKWIAPTGILQTWAGASNMNVGDVIALRDNRDNEVYTVAKLADNNVWITENLRLVPNTANITAKNTNNPTAAFLAAVPSSSSSTTQCSTDDSPCNDQVYFYTGNMDRTKEQAPTGNEVRYAWYSYGTMYNWYTATAGHGVNSKSSGSVDGDICPSGWHLPTGGSSGEYAALSTALGGTSSTGATNIRKYPNNFIWSGDYNPSTGIPDGRGTQARIWSTTANSAAKSYRMGFNSSSITPAGTWNKWDNFAVRCIYQGGNIPYSHVTVDFEGTGISSITFENSNYGTETATPASPTVSIAEEAAYTVTATMTTGYEVSSWTTAANGTLGDSTTNPAANPNTYTITGDTTLTVTGAAIPTYDVTITLGEHVTGISFYHTDYGTTTITPASASCTNNNDDTYTCTTSLRRGIEYTLSSSYEYAYTLHEWTIGSNSTIGSTTSVATTYSITGNTTLGITAEEADELTYTLVYSAGQGTDAPDSITETNYNNIHTFTITNSAPIYYGYTFTGWSETADANNNGTTVDYTSGDTITVATTGVTTTKILYPVYQAVSTCPSSRICYYENGADVIGGGRGTMANQSASSNSSAKLIPTNYSKAGYGFAGWTTSENATPYGPNATITTPDLSSTGLALYAKWVKSTGTLQTWNDCNNLNTNDVTALTDSRDNETYAVAKLGDDKCWIIENLRLVPSTANITSANTHNPASGFATEAASSSSSDALCTTDDSSTCINQLQYNTNSLNRSLTQSYNAVSNSAGWYSYGVYYNWYTATAGNGTMETEANTNATGDICPSKWHLPTSTSSGEWAALNTAVNGGVSNADAGLRQYPVNLIWSGDYNGSSRTSGYGNGRYWAATGYDTNNAYRMGHQESGSKGSTPSGNFKKWDGFAVRCIYDGDIANPHSVTVTLPTGVESITFTNSTGTQTATPQDNTVSLAENAAYTITANMTTGYELVSWTGGSNSAISDSSANPTTIRITDDTTLTATTQLIPSYTVNVTFDSHITSIGFYNANYTPQQVTPQNSTDNNNGTYTGTVTMYKNASYTVSPVFATGYKISSWATTANGTLSTTTNPVTTYTVTDTATLTLTNTEKTGSTTLLPGQDLNAKMKTVAKGTDTYSSDRSYEIKALRMVNALPDGFVASSTNTVSTSNSTYPIYIFFDNTNDAGIMYFYTEAKDIYMNADSSYAFFSNEALADISALASWNTSNVTNMYAMFSTYDSYLSTRSLADISALASWNTSNVTNMGSMFGNTFSLTNIDALANWDTSSVTNMSTMFSDARTLTDISALTNWDTSSVTDISGMFFGASALANIDALANWDTSNVTNMKAMFSGASALANIDALANWDTSNVTNMETVFGTNFSLTNIDALANWDTSNVIGMGSMFRSTRTLTNIDALANWDTSNVIGMGSMFSGASALANIDALANWDTSSVTSMSHMFDEASALTNINGARNWNTSSVTSMSHMFEKASALTNINGAKNWSTNKVTDMRNMFRDTNTNINGSAINNWNISAVFAANGDSTYNNNGFFCIFGNTSISHNYNVCDGNINANHPNFTKRLGTWNSNGTFIPSNTTNNTVTITVNFDSHISSVKISEYSYSSPTQTVSTSGNTVSLSRNKSYIITATLASGYQLARWDPGDKGIISSHDLTLNTVVFTAYDDTILTAISQPAPNDIVTTVNMDSHISKVSFRCFECGTYYYNPTSINDYVYDPVIGTVTTNGGTITLKQDVTYKVTASLANGYEVSSWTTVGGTISNNAGTHTNFTPSSNSTITVSSTASAPTHTITVNMDSNVSYVVFTNENYPKKVAIRNGFTVDLRENTPYTVTAYTKNGYGLSTWSTTTNGTLSSTTANPTIYTVTDTATITATSEEILPYNVTVNFSGTGINSVSFDDGANTQTVTASGDTVSLNSYTNYTVTATAATGYEITSWSTASGGTLTSTSANPTTYTVTGATTLSVNSQATPSYTVTVNFDEHVSSIGFYNADYTTQQLTPQNSTDNGDGTYTGTVTLRKNVPYTVSPAFVAGYKSGSWSTTANGTLSTTTNPVTTYTVTDTATLTLTSIEKTGSTTLLPGQELNAKMKTLAEGSNKTYSDDSTKIKALRMADSLPAGFTPSTANTVSTSDSAYPIYIFFDNTNDAGIMYFYTEAKDIYMNADSSYAFSYNLSLTDLTGLENCDTSNVTNMSYMFYDASSLTDLAALKNWDTSNVRNMRYMFSSSGASSTSLTDLSALENWDTSNVTDMGSMFFYASSLTDLTGLENWDTSSVTYMHSMFRDASSLTDLTALENWDTSNVTDMRDMFYNTSSLTDLTALENWDTSNVRNMSAMFYNTSSLTDLTALENWDTSNVTNMGWMFYNTTSLTDASAIDDWDIRAVRAEAGSPSYSSNYFYRMFYRAGGSSSPVHPNFTKRSGTWDSDGTFIPGNTTSNTVTVTVTFDSHIRYVEVGGTTISTSGGTVSLTRGNSYTITATLDSGYELANWDPGEHGVISSNDLIRNSVKFSASASTTLTATSQVVPNDVTTTVNMDSHISKVTFRNSKYNNSNTGYVGMVTTNGGTITLKQGATYKVTASLTNGYEVSSWTTVGGTVSNNAGTHTNFTPSGNSTITVSSATAAPAHTVTVNMDSNVSYVVFTNDNYPTRVAVKNGSTVDFRENTPYTVTAYTKTGYILNSWSTTANGTLTSTTTNPTTYTVTDTATLTVTSATLPSITDLTYMQDFATLSSAAKTNVLNSMTLNQQYTLKDNRDQKDYYISKLADGNVWMTQNLDFDIVSGGANLDYTNTDVPSNWSDAGNLTNTYTTGTTTWNSSKTTPASYDPGDLCWNGVLGNYDLSTGTTACDAGNKHYHIGNYYNWTAAIAMSDSSSYTANTTDVDQSICPAGWRLPTETGNKSYYNLVNTLSLTSGTSGNIQNSPVYFVYGGGWCGYSFFVGNHGDYWSSVVSAADFASALSFSRTGDLYPRSSYDRDDSSSVRCVAR